MTTRYASGVRYAGVAFALSVLVAVEVAAAGPSASRVIDRTVVCSVSGTGSPDVVRLMTVYGWNGDPGVEISPRIGVEAAGEKDAVTAGATTGPMRPATNGIAWLSRVHCSPTKVRVPLAATGLRAVEGYNAYRCDVPARVLVRLRAEFRRPVSLVRDRNAPWRSIARGRIDAATVVVASFRGRKPIMFARATGADPSGKGRALADQSRCDPFGT